MFIRCGNTIVNTENVASIKVYPEGRPMPGTGVNADPQPDALAVEITTTAPDYDYQEYAQEFIGMPAHTVILRAEDAERFLVALPVYEPVMEEGS